MDFTIEELSLNAWPALKTMFYDGWIIRMADGYSFRSNSINMIYPSKINIEEKINYCDEVFKRHSIQPAYKILSCGEHKVIDETLKNLSYEKIYETIIQLCEIPEFPKRNIEGIMVSGAFDEEWKKSVIEFNKIEEKHKTAFKNITGSVAVEKIVVRKEAGGETVGCGYAALERNHAGLFSITVKESQRGKGYGREIAETLLTEAAKRGIRNSYLQVDYDNTAALSLYEKLGYREAYRYWYRKAKH